MRQGKPHRAIQGATNRTQAALWARENGIDRDGEAEGELKAH
jgi:hypothetical protein